MDIDFDLGKDAANREKHGVSLAFGERIFGDPAAYVVRSVRAEDREERSKIIGMADGRLWTAVYVERGGTTRFISVRRSNEPETRGYHRHPG